MVRIQIALLALPLTFACGKTEVRGGGDGKPAAVAPEPTEPAKPQPRPPKVDQAGSPHAGMANPHAPASGKPKGPPREVEPSGKTQARSIAELAFAVPIEWEQGQPRSTMRLAEFTIPGPGGDAELVVFRFPGGAGGVEANIERWKSQFAPPEGKRIDDMTTVEKRKQGELEVTVVDVRGRYVAAMMPGADATHDEEDYRMIAAIIEGSGDAFFFKTVGPDKTLAAWDEAHAKMIESIATAS